MTDAHDVIYKALWDVGLSDPGIETEQVLASLEEAGYVVVKSNEKKLSAADVREIRKLYRKGETQVDISYLFDINPATVSRIVRGEYH